MMSTEETVDLASFFSECYIWANVADIAHGVKHKRVAESNRTVCRQSVAAQLEPLNFFVHSFNEQKALAGSAEIGQEEQNSQMSKSGVFRWDYF